MRPRNVNWLTHTVLALGVALRIAFGVATPYDSAYDDHFEPVAVILEQGVLPSATDCWECFQPPLYYVVSAGVFSATTRLAALGGASGEMVEAAGRKAIQFLSVAAGCVTLYVCLAVLRLAGGAACGAGIESSGRSGWREALSIGIVALLPRHIYMSAGASNDALAYLLATLAIYAALLARHRNWPAGPCLTAGALAGATVLCKGYGLMTASAILIAAGLCLHIQARRRPGNERRAQRRPVVLMLAAMLAVGVWPTVRNLAIYDRPHVDNFDFFDTPMSTQPPGSIAATSFASFRMLELLRHPWIHVSHVDSFWTELYARLWFDYEGFATSLAGHGPWERHWEALRERWEVNRAGQVQWPPERWASLFDYGEESEPPNLRRAGIVAYLAGLPLTACVLMGLLLSLRRFGRDFAATLLSLHLLFALAVVLFQTLRLPHFAAMKAAFVLGGLSSVPVLAAALLAWSRPNVARAVGCLMVASLVAVALTDAAQALVRFGILER